MKSLFLLYIGLLLLPGCSGLKEDPDSLVVVNVLDKKFYKDAHIPGSIQVSFMDVEEKAKKWSKNKTIVVYCSNYACTASGSVVRRLTNQGFKNAYAYKPGAAGWKQAGHSLVGPQKEAYLTAPNEEHAGRRHDALVKEISTKDLKKLIDKKEQKRAA